MQKPMEKKRNFTNSDDDGEDDDKTATVAQSYFLWKTIELTMRNINIIGNVKFSAFSAMKGTTCIKDARTVHSMCVCDEV